MVSRLIVHADDFGLSEEVNDGIIDACTHGILTSASIMPCGAAFRDAIERAKQRPSLDIGVHLTLVEERPVSPPEAVRSLVSPDDRFFDRAATFAKRYLTGRIRRQEIRTELQGQIEAVLAAGIRATHLDSHQHLHMLPGIWDVVCDLAKRFQIHAVRYPRERLRAYMLRERGRNRLIRMLALNMFCAFAQTGAVRTTDSFAGFFFGGHVNRRNLHTMIDNLPPTGTCELMCHPGKDQRDDRYLHWRYHWQEELQALTDPVVAERLRQKNVGLISFRDV